MTMPGPTQQAAQPVHTIQLPPPGYPMVTRMISDPLFPPSAGGSDAPITWVVAQAHPLVTSMKIVRMFIEPNGVAVYSVSDDGMSGMRNLVPMDCTRLVEEAMPLDVFADELQDAEDAAGPVSDDDDDGGGGDEGDGDDAPAQQQPTPPLRTVPHPTQPSSTPDPAPAPPSDGQPAS